MLISLWDKTETAAHSELHARISLY